MKTWRILTFTVIALGQIGWSGEISFNRDIRPILSDKCFACHGPDSENQQSELRLDTFAHATADLGGYAGVVPGDLKESELHWRVHSDDPADTMPPPDAKMKLTEEEKETLDRWIEAGAAYEKHWSFEAIPPSIDVPEIEGEPELHPIDRFVLARLAEEGLAPAGPADPEKWLRRVTFDLTGLPPTLEEIDAFLADPSDEARESVVDRLLASEAAAERLATGWLDVARYSDTYGFQVDRDRSVWRWRDWVIGAFHANQPYDQFIIDQIAGDLIPDATRDQKLATAFNRLHPQKVEGGSVPEEFRIEYVSDRVHTYATAFLGLTMECARCHDHKYDPLTMREYYGLSAFFDNIDEAGLYSYFTPSVPTPTLWLPDEKQEKELAAAESAIATEEKALARIANEATEDFAAWLKQAKPSDLLPPDPDLSYSFDEREGDAYAASEEGAEPATTTARNTATEGIRGKALRLTGDDALKIPDGNFTRDQPFTISLWVRTPDHKKRAVIFARSKAWTDAASRGYELLLEDGKPSAALIHFYPGNAIRVRAKEVLPVGSWHELVLTYDGSSRASGVRLYLDGTPMKTEIVRDTLTREITGGGNDHIVIGERMRDNGFKNGLVDEFALFRRELSPAEVKARHEGEPISGEDAGPLFLAKVHPPYAAQVEKLAAARSERSRIVKGIAEIMVMEEMAAPRKTFVLERGHYAEKGDPVDPVTPAALHDLPEGAPSNRLGLAQWTVTEENPLTARVTVNRYWQMLFGTGLVVTSEDFGSQGRLPTHPELLDWLARDFIDSGWDLRRLLKQIVLSATYGRESSIPSGQHVERDPENEWLWRFPPAKLSAEMLRDNALAVSGLLVDTVGGPPVKPYDIAVSFKPSQPDTGSGLYRRSLYTYWKQTAPAPMMTTLDASKRDVCRVRREKTDSPLQALVMLNSPQFAEAARVLGADLVARHAGDDEALITEAFRLMTSRRPSEREWPILRTLYDEQLAHFRETPDEAAKLLAAGQHPPSETADPTRTAAVTVLVLTLLNFDECTSKR